MRRAGRTPFPVASAAQYPQRCWPPLLVSYQSPADAATGANESRDSAITSLVMSFMACLSRLALRMGALDEALCENDGEGRQPASA